MEKAKLFEALHTAYSACGYVSKSGTNTIQKYNYAGEAEMIKALRPALHDAGLTVHPHNVEMLSNEQYTTAKGALQNRIVLKYTFRFTDKAGDYFDVVAIGEGTDSGDKASYKAATGALKYALRQTLLIETGDDPESVREQQVAEETAEKLEAKDTFNKLLELIANSTELEKFEFEVAALELKLGRMCTADAKSHAIITKRIGDKMYELLKPVAADFEGKLSATQTMQEYQTLANDLRGSAFLRIATSYAPNMARDTQTVFAKKKGELNA